MPTGSGAGELVVAFDKKPSKGDKATYNILDTDYETYSIVYVCDSYMNVASFDFLYILAREPYLDDATMLTLVDKIVKFLPDYGYFENT